MANLVISAAGAAVGYMIGGPTGAQIGWMIGSAATANKANPQQQTIGDLTIQTASFGTNIPVIVGRQRVAGNIIWGVDKVPYTIDSHSGGKGGTGGTTPAQTGYRVSLAIAICKGPILGVSRIWADGNLIVDARVNANNLIGTLYTGSNTQNPDPTMESHLGAGNVPAYRGLAYIVLNNFDLGVSGRIPNFNFEVVKSGGI